MGKERIIIMMVCVMAVVITINILRILRRIGGSGARGAGLFRPAAGRRDNQKPEPGNFINYFMIILALISIILMLMFPQK